MGLCLYIKLSKNMHSIEKVVCLVVNILIKVEINPVNRHFIIIVKFEKLNGTFVGRDGIWHSSIFHFVDIFK